MDNLEKNKNLKKYISTLDNIKPDDELVNKTIQKIRNMKMQELEKQSKKESSSVFNLQMLSKITAGVAAAFVISIVGTKFIFDNKPYSQNYISGIKQTTEYKDNTEIDLKYVELDNFLNDIEFSKINNNNFIGMYLVNTRNNNGKWLDFNYSSNYNDFQNFKNMLAEFPGNTYILENLGKIDMSVSSMCVQINYNYEIYIPSDVNGEIIIAKKDNNKTQACCIQLDKQDEEKLNNIRKFIINTGVKCDEEPGSIDRNALN